MFYMSKPHCNRHARPLSRLFLDGGISIGYYRCQFHDRKQKEIPILTLPPVLARLQQFHADLGWIFRGQTNSDWTLIPRGGTASLIFETCHSNPDRAYWSHPKRRDLGRFRHWRSLLLDIRNTLPQNDFECLAYAQHYGLPTRLLDWTENSLVALYFACEALSIATGLFTHLSKRPFDIDVKKMFAENDNPYHVSRVARIKNSALRPAAFGSVRNFPLFPPDPHRGLFGYRCRSALNMPEWAWSVQLSQIVIPAESKLIIHRELRDVGFTRRAMFPDLEGLSESFAAEDHYLDAFNRSRTSTRDSTPPSDEVPAER